MNVHLTQSMSLPMYALPEMEQANAAFLAALRRRFQTKDVDIETGRSGSSHDGNFKGGNSDVLFTQMCGYPLFKHDRRRYRILATPHYALPGCSGSSHRAFFMVRTDDSAKCLGDLRGRAFGCNSVLSNTGMNLPRLSLARVAGSPSFFSSVTITGAHLSSLRDLATGTIDVCSVDSVTWGLFKKFDHAAAARFRILDETVSSPCLPFVTSLEAARSGFAELREALNEVVNDPALSAVREVLAIADLSDPDIQAYERLAQHEREAAELGFPEIN
jgi:ABC-type phosphate/phosphonate transport system substrate-binding protein